MAGTELPLDRRIVGAFGFIGVAGRECVAYQSSTVVAYKLQVVIHSTRGDTPL